MYKELYETIETRLKNNTALNAFLAQAIVFGFREELVNNKMPYLIVEPGRIVERAETVPLHKSGKLTLELHGKIENDNEADLVAETFEFIDLIFNALDGGPNYTEAGELITVTNTAESIKKIGDNAREIIIITEYQTKMFKEGDR